MPSLITTNGGSQAATAPGTPTSSSSSPPSSPSPQTHLQQQQQQPKQPQHTTPPILIIGAGIVGLTLAQSLARHSIPYRIFERDAHPHSRGFGWGLTMHWALPAFLALLPPQLVDRLPETYVDQEAMDRGENGNFILFDLSTGDVRWKVPPSKRIRVSRERLRKLLMEGVDVQWSKQLERFDVLPGDSGVTVYFEDGSSATGSMLLGCDGSRSRMRKLLCPNTYQNTQLPCRLLGVSVPYPAEKGLKMRALDPFFLQAGDPKTDSFLYFSFLDTPTNRRHPRDTFLCQILTSWPYRPGFLSSPEPIEVPDTNSARLALMKRISAEWVEPFHSIIADIPSDTEAKSINLEDWQPHAGAWDNHHGRVTLLGDAAHAMTMFRGEAANHGITDAASWLAALLPVLSSGGAWDGEALRAAVDSYEAEMVKRCGPAVLASRRACLDAHEHARIDETSPLVNKRAMVVD